MVRYVHESNYDQDALVEDPHVLVNRICWSTDGSLFGKFGDMVMPMVFKLLISTSSYFKLGLSISFRVNRSCIFKTRSPNIFLSWGQ